MQEILTNTYTNTSAEPGAESEISRPACCRVKVLVIDDDPDFRALVRVFLNNTPFDVVEASDGVKGLAALAYQPVDVLITDIVMPEQEGLSTIFRAHREFPELKILAVSGVHASSEYLRSAKVFGAQASLEKPITREQLLAALCQLGVE